MRYSFLHAADLHLDSPLRGLDRYDDAPIDALRNATRRAFENLVRRAIELRVEFVILAGDVFDGDWKDFGTGLWFTARLRELTQKGIRVYLLAGNHDAEGRMTRELELPLGAYRFATGAPQSFVDEKTGAVLHGQGFAKAATTSDLAAAYPAARPGTFNIGVLHTALDGREGHDDYAPCSKETLIAKGYDYWALGHVHRREVVSRDPWIVFPGNLQSRHVREVGAKGATFVNVADGRIASVEHESLDVVRFAHLRVDLTKAVRRAECLDAIGDAIEAARADADGRLLAARLELTGTTEAHSEMRRRREAFVAECRDRANAIGETWLEKIVIATRAPASASGRDIVDQLDLEAADLVEEAMKAARLEIDTLLEKLPAGLDPSREDVDLRDPEFLDALVRDAREDVVRRLLDAASGVTAEDGE